jgi:glyoxylase-like metal-dependent hydrolase (beta-lactamase superfamily II)
MSKRSLSASFCLLILGAAAWVGGISSGDRQPESGWIEVAPGIWRTRSLPAGHALVDGDGALLIGAPAAARGLPGVKKIETVLLNHHHRDLCAEAKAFLADGVPVRAPKIGSEWLTPDNVRKYWQTALPMRGSRGAYFVLPVGLPGVDCSLEDGQTIAWRGWSIQALAAPGASHDHFAYTARKGKDGPLVLFCGDALALPGKLWAPYTTDWDHWTDAGLTPAARSLRRLADWKPALVLPAHGDPIRTDAAGALIRTAVAVEEVAFLKSFERYTKQRLGNTPQYRFLAQEQVASNGSKPWTQVSDHLFLTGNTYVLTSKETAAYAVLDPWDPHSARQLPQLREQRKLGSLELLMFTHAHFDHYDGVYSIHERDRDFQTWALDRVAEPLAEPLRWRAPFLDVRPVKFDRRFKDGETAQWREYRFRFHHLPGQTEFTMGIETVIDGKKCFFTADNFFHQDQFSGSGGWMGLNRSYPLPYAASAQKVLDAAPDWVLAEHGGPFEFNAEDFRRRVRWGRACAAAADAICLSRNHRRDWDPHRIHVEPLIQKAKPGAVVDATLMVANSSTQTEALTIALDGRGEVADQSWQLTVKPGEHVQRPIRLRLSEKIAPGRQVFALHGRSTGRPDEADPFLVIDVDP